MVYSEVPNFSEPNPELLAQANQQNKSVSTLRKLASWCRPLKNTGCPVLMQICAFPQINQAKLSASFLHASV